MLTAAQIKTLQILRKELHHHPEISGEEVETAARILRFMQQHAPSDEVSTNLDGYGLNIVNLSLL